MKRTGLNIICSLLLAGGMCACTATPKQDRRNQMERTYGSVGNATFP